MKASIIALALLIIASAAPARAQVFSADIGEIRKVSATIPGARALKVNVIKFAESRRTKNFSIKGAPNEPSIQARTAFQVVYPDGYVMIDSGMDQQVHRFFGRGVEEPYFPEQEKRVEQALMGAKSIVMTHEHGDHVAGVVRGPMAAQFAGKTVLTKTQIQTLLTNPQMPEIKLSPEQAQRYIVVDYDHYMAFAPGFTLIKSPGHTPGSQMIYVVLQSGKEYLFAGDVAWHMDGVRRIIGKDAPWITEDEPQMTAELTWLNGLSKSEKNLVIVVSHDEEQRLQYIRDGVLGDRLE